MAPCLADTCTQAPPARAVTLAVLWCCAAMGWAPQPTAAAASALDLDASAAYAVLASAEVTNTGTTRITGGHVGVCPGTSVTGFGSVVSGGTVQGGTVHTGGAAAQKAQKAALAAYTDAKGRAGATALDGDAGLLHDDATPLCFVHRLCRRPHAVRMSACPRAWRLGQDTPSPFRPTRGRFKSTLVALRLHVVATQCGVRAACVLCPRREKSTPRHLRCFV